MSRYYQTQMMVNEAIELAVKKAKEGIDVNLLAYELTKKFAISELYIRKRLLLMEKIGAIGFEEGCAVWLLK